MLDMEKMNQQMLSFYKTNFDNSYNAMMMLHEQMERLGAMYWGQLVSLPEEAKKDMTEWTRSYMQTCADFKKMVDENFNKLANFTA